MITGFGRTGRWFGLEHYGIEPDIMQFAKGITSGYVPLGGIGVSDEIRDVIDQRAGQRSDGCTPTRIPVIRPVARWRSATSTSSRASGWSSAPRLRGARFQARLGHCSRSTASVTCARRA